MRRDKTEKISRAEVSLVAAALRERLEHLRRGSGGEVDRILAQARPLLEEVAERGGDPRFVLRVLASARWRRLRPPGTKFPRWIRLLERLARDDELHRLLATNDVPRGALKAASADALAFLKSFTWMDEGPFDSSTTRRDVEGERWRSQHVRRAAAVLNWHLREGTSGRYDRVHLLARLLTAFGLVQSRTAEAAPVETVRKRLQRIEGDYYERFAIPVERITFHEFHQLLAVEQPDSPLGRCGTACPPSSPGH